MINHFIDITYNPVINPKKECIVCHKPSLARGFCNMHLKRFKKNGDLNFNPRKDVYKFHCEACGNPKCEAKGLCATCYTWVRRNKIFWVQKKRSFKASKKIRISIMKSKTKQQINKKEIYVSIT